MEILRCRVYAYRAILVFYFGMVMNGGFQFSVVAQSRDVAVNEKVNFQVKTHSGPQLLGQESSGKGSIASAPRVCCDSDLQPVYYFCLQ